MPNNTQQPSTCEAPLPPLPREWLSPLPFGDDFLPSRLLPSPLEGLTGGVLLECYARHSLTPCWITPFIRVSNAIPGRTRLHRRLRPFFTCGLPVVVQLMGTHGELLAATAERCCQLGAVGVDLNCGCPSKTVVASGAGGARLRQPAWIAQTLRAMRQACPGRGVSVKLRSGLADPAELREIMPAVREATPDFAIVHFRTVAEQYATVKNGYERIALAKSLAGDMPLLASGDLFGVDDAVAAWRTSGCDGVAPARGLLRNPYLIEDLRQTCLSGRIPSPRAARETLDILEEMARLAAGRGVRQTGFLLEIARHAFGADSTLFARLAACRTPAELADGIVDSQPL